MKAVLLATTIALGCGGGGKTAAGPAATPVSNSAEPGDGAAAAAVTDAEIDAIVEESIAMSTRLGTATAGKDCAGIAAAIDAETDRSAAYFARLARINTGPDAERVQARVKARGYDAQMIAATKPLLDHVTPCFDDDAVKAAMDRMTRAMGGPYSERK